MEAKKELIEQTNLAFDFIQKMYLEVSYLIKEIEGILHEEEEIFEIGRPSGYAISARSSIGLESTNVNLWLMKKLAVFFCSQKLTKPGTRGTTITKIENNLKVLYLRIVLNDKNNGEPTIYSGVLYDIQKKKKWFEKFEQVMQFIEYNDSKIFKDTKKIDYEDVWIKFKGKLIKNNLFEINDSKSILKTIIKPSLELYRKY